MRIRIYVDENAPMRKFLIQLKRYGLKPEFFEYDKKTQRSDAIVISDIDPKKIRVEGAIRGVEAAG